MIQPKNDDIQAARSYIRRRLAAENAMEHYLDRQLMKAAQEIVSLAYSMNIPPTMFSFEYDPVLSYKVRQIIARLNSLIEEYDITLALNTDKMDNKELSAYIFRDINGTTYSQRLNAYTNKFKSEMESFIKAGLIAGLSKSGLIDEIERTYKHPKQGSIITEDVRKGFSSYGRLLMLTRHTIADAWMYADMEYYRKKGAIGFMTFRGSSYPCDICSDYAGRLHTFAEPYPPLHPNCVCYAVPIYKL